MWKKKLRQKKIQFLLIGIILFFASAIFSACLCFTVATQSYATAYYAKNKCPEVFVTVGSGAPAGQLLSQLKSDRDFTRIVSLDGRSTSVKLLHDGHDISPGFYTFYALPDYHSLSWQVTPISGKTNADGPAPGEIWIPQLYADHQHIRIGDKIELKGSATALTVSATLDDATCPSSMFGIYPLYVAKSTLDSEIGGQSCKMMAINSKTSYSQVESWLRSRPSSITKGLMDTYNVSQLLLSFRMYTLILGSIGMLSAVLIFVVSIIIIRFLIKNNILKEYRSIGIYKALGFTDQQIAGFYFKCYALTGFAGLTLGAAAGLPLGTFIGKFITRYITGFHLSYSAILLAVGGAAALFLLLLFFVYRAHRQIERITPVQALQMGTNSTQRKLTRSVLRSASSPLATAVNDLCKHRSFSVMFMIILTVSFYLCALFISINYSCGHIAEHADIWFGIPKADDYISGNLTPDNITAVKNDPAVAKIISGTPIIDTSIRTEKNAYGVSFNEGSVICWSDFLNADFLPPCKIGRAPKYADEIAVSSGSIKGSSLTVGDYITLTVGIRKKTYLVTGIYDNMMHANQSIEMTPQGLLDTGVAYQPTAIAILFKNGADISTFKARMNDFGLTVDRKMDTLQDSITGVEEVINPVTILLVAVFVLFSLLNILNLLLTTQIENRRKFGILKALGFTTAYISLQSFFKTLLLSVSSAAIALLLNALLSPRLFYAFLHINALINSPAALSILIGSMLAGMLTITLLFCIPLRRIAPTELMDE